MESSPLLILLLCYFLHDNICVKKKNFIHLSLQAWVSHCVKRGDTPYLSLFSPNVGIYGPE